MSKKQEPELTPMFPKGTQPHRGGLYQVEIRGAIKWACWRKDHWTLALRTPESARSTRIRSMDCYGPGFGGWRGLTKKAS